MTLSEKNPDLASLMMVTYNRLELTKQTLESLVETVEGHPYELIVIDNASADSTLEYLYGFQDKLGKDRMIVKENKENRGIAIGRNQALKLSSGKWLSTLDNDVMMPKGWLGSCIEILKSSPQYGMIGVNMENTQYPIVRKGDLEWQDKPQGNLGTACTVFPRTLHKMLGYFVHGRGVKYSHEDADFGFRMTRCLGFKIGYLKDPGKHLGEGDNDVGEYREFKNKEHAANLQNFYTDCSLYLQRKKSIYIPFEES